MFFPTNPPHSLGVPTNMPLNTQLLKVRVLLLSLLPTKPPWFLPALRICILLIQFVILLVPCEHATTPPARVPVCFIEPSTVRFLISALLMYLNGAAYCTVALYAIKRVLPLPSNVPSKALSFASPTILVAWIDLISLTFLPLKLLPFATLYAKRFQSAAFLIR